MRALGRARLLAVVLLSAGVLVGAASAGWTQLQSAGGITVKDEPECAGSGNSSKVTVPFSILITGLTPLSETSVGYVTDMDANPKVLYGPITIPNVDAQGNTCIEVLRAPPGQWKIDVVEEGSGFTDSKVITVEG